MSAPTPLRVPKPPAGLAPRGRRLWRSVVSNFQLSESETALLIEAVRVLDDVERLEQALAAEPLTTIGSRGQDCINPLRPELRSQRLLLSKLLGQLGVQDAAAGGDEWSGLTTSARARKASRVRWDNRGGS